MNELSTDHNDSNTSDLRYIKLMPCMDVTGKFVLSARNNGFMQPDEVIR